MSNNASVGEEEVENVPSGSNEKKQQREEFS